MDGAGNIGFFDPSSPDHPGAHRAPGQPRVVFDDFSGKVFGIGHATLQVMDPTTLAIEATVPVGLASPNADPVQPPGSLGWCWIRAT
ncbi:MAG: hypothetical protein H6736_21735 [Alphaproteobacteria bacterium]|nr:hypothetical protein [Alphaproteobacteria bacterium]